MKKKIIQIKRIKKENNFSNKKLVYGILIFAAGVFLFALALSLNPKKSSENLEGELASLAGFSSSSACEDLRKSASYSSDMDNDGKVDICDNCIKAPNSNQADYDNDGVGDVCDKYSKINYYSQGKDKDQDGVPDAEDSEPNIGRNQISPTTSPTPSPTSTASPSPSPSPTSTASPEESSYE